MSAPLFSCGSKDCHQSVISGFYQKALELAQSKSLNAPDKHRCIEMISQDLFDLKEWDLALQVAKMIPDSPDSLCRKSYLLTDFVLQLIEESEFEKALLTAAMIPQGPPNRWIHAEIGKISKRVFVSCCTAAQSPINRSTPLHSFLGNSLFDKHLVALIGTFL